MSFEKRLALEASAGSGKTFALTTRYISLLLNGANPSNIVALTFTKKAAGEMRERVYHTMQDLENRKAELGELCSILGLSEDEVLRKKDEALPLFLKANIKISTIDAFFGQILRKFALHLGLMPDFNSVIENGDKPPPKLQKLFLKNAKAKNAYNLLVHFALREQKSLKYFFGLLSLMYEKNSEIGEWKYPRIGFPNESAVLRKVLEIKTELQKLGANERAVALFAVEDLSELVKKTFWEKESLNYWDFKKVYTPKLDELFFSLKEALRDFYLQKERYRLGELFALFDLYKNAKKTMAKQNNELSFDDITNSVYELLRTQNIDSDFLYFRLDSVIEHLLIDEFQDTNIVQYKILEPIIEEIESGIGTKEFKSFFYVGDIKQSIYRFRGGAKSLFAHTAKSFGVNIEPLDKNYRSGEAVVEFVNDVFESKITGYTRQKAIKTGGFVSVLARDDTDDVLDGVQKSVQKLLTANIAPGDIAILCSTNKDAETIRDALSEKFPTLSVQTESSVKLIDSKSVQAILEFLKYLYFKDELFGRNFQALRGISFEELPSIEGFNKNDTPLFLVISCIKKFSLGASDADIVLFLEVVSRYNDLESLLFAYEDISEKSSGQQNDGLKLLTIHKSKGLEFPYVIAADKLQKENNHSDLMIFDYDDISLRNIYLNFAKREFVDENYKKAKEKEKKLEEEDRLNQLYVAFTRAQEGLFVVKKEKNSLFEILELEEKSSGEIAAISAKEPKTAAKPISYEGNSFGKQNALSDEKKIEGSLENIHFGLALHFTLEMMTNFNAEELVTALNFAKNRYGKLLDAEAFKSIKKRVSNLINDKQFAQIIKSGEVFKEQPYMFEGKRKQIDIMVESVEKMVIIDYKSSFLAKESHTAQVNEYKNALALITQKKVEAYLCYLHEKQIEMISL